MTYIYKEDSSNPNVQDERPVGNFLWLIGITFVILAGALYAVAFASEYVLLSLSPEREQAFFSGLNFEEGVDWPTGKPLLEKLVGATEAATIKLKIMDDEDPNAFALPGRTIIVTCGLLSLVSSENGLAFVLAHEVGHLHNRDHLRGLGRAVGVSALLGVLGFDTTASGLAQGTADIMQRSFSRDQEGAADEVAIELVTKAYGGLNGASEFFDHIDEEPRYVQILSTHPLPQDRAQKLKQLGTAGTIVPLNPELRSSCTSAPADK